MVLSLSPSGGNGFWVAGLQYKRPSLSFRETLEWEARLPLANAHLWQQKKKCYITTIWGGGACIQNAYKHCPGWISALVELFTKLLTALHLDCHLCSTMSKSSELNCRLKLSCQRCKQCITRSAYSGSNECQTRSCGCSAAGIFIPRVFPYSYESVAERLTWASHSEHT